jgi:predicted Zn-dependent peptidase
MEKSIMGLTNALPSAELLPKNFEEYNLDNGLHVMHHDPSAPVVITSVMYHVGSKDESEKGFAHFSNIYYLKD